MELQWPLMIFTLFVCLGAGTFGVQGLLSLLGRGAKVQLPALIVSFVAIVIGGLGSFFHLQHWERIFNGFGHMTSGITQELIAIVVFVIVLAIYFVLLRKSGEDPLPKWCGIAALVISVVLVVIMSHSYNMAARPIWDTSLLWLYYLANAVLFGGFSVMAIVAVKKDEASLSTKKDKSVAGVAILTSTVGVIAQTIVTAAYLAFFSMASNAYTNVGNYFDPAHPTKAMQDPASALAGVATGSEAALFWFGVVVVGLLVPAIMVFLAKKKGNQTNLIAYAGIGLVAALAGGMCFRVILYVLGFSVFVFY